MKKWKANETKDGEWHVINDTGAKVAYVLGATGMEVKLNATWCYRSDRQGFAASYNG